MKIYKNGNSYNFGYFRYYLSFYNGELWLFKSRETGKIVKFSNRIILKAYLFLKLSKFSNC